MNSSNLKRSVWTDQMDPARLSSSSLTVLSVAYPLLPVHSGSAGGAEQILHLIDRGLIEAGHRSLVIAARGSQVSGLLIETAVADGEIDDGVIELAQHGHLRAIKKALERYSVDLIHFHGLDFLSYLPWRDLPMLATLHLPVQWYPRRVLELDTITLNCVSRTQAATVPSERRLPVVENGIDIDAFSHAQAQRRGLLWLGRICPEKGVDVALRVAHRLARPLTIAGPVHPFEWHQRYFRGQIAPLLDDYRRYIGPVSFAEKRELLAHAECVLIPSLAAETSSLVAMEAGASGAAVVAFSAGALPEVIEQGKTGFLVRNEDEMTEAVEHAHAISPEICRQIAVRRFDFRKMVWNYLSLYEEMLAGKVNATAAR
jgi:glycosyltransferase involved in cell wall biosynthesis